MKSSTKIKIKRALYIMQYRLIELMKSKRGEYKIGPGVGKDVSPVSKRTKTQIDDVEYITESYFSAEGQAVDKIGFLISEEEEAAEEEEMKMSL